MDGGTATEAMEARVKKRWRSSLPCSFCEVSICLSEEGLLYEKPDKE